MAANGMSGGGELGSGYLRKETILISRRREWINVALSAVG